MPIYEYRCSNDHTFEVMQRMSDGPVETCEVCDSPVQRVYHPVAIHFKGSGFHNTDYKTSKNGARSSDSSTESETGSETGSGKTPEGSGSEKPKESSSSSSGEASKGEKVAAK